MQTSPPALAPPLFPATGMMLTPPSTHPATGITHMAPPIRPQSMYSAVQGPATGDDRFVAAEKGMTLMTPSIRPQSMYSAVAWHSPRRMSRGACQYCQREVTTEHQRGRNEHTGCYFHISCLPLPASRTPPPPPPHSSEAVAIQTDIHDGMPPYQTASSPATSGADASTLQSSLPSHAPPGHLPTVYSERIHGSEKARYDASRYQPASSVVISQIYFEKPKDYTNSRPYNLVPEPMPKYFHPQDEDNWSVPEEAVGNEKSQWKWNNWFTVPEWLSDPFQVRVVFACKQVYSTRYGAVSDTILTRTFPCWRWQGNKETKDGEKRRASLSDVVDVSACCAPDHRASNPAAVLARREARGERVLGLS